MRYRIDFSRVRKLAEVSGNNTYLCYQCGTCTASCLLAPSISVRRAIKYAQIGYLPSNGGEVWRCISCKYCDARCPRGVEIAKIMRGFKREFYEAKQSPNELTEALWRVYEEGNPLGSPRRERSAWASGIKLDDKPDVVLYTCCLAAYDRRLQKVLRSLVDVLKRAGVRVGILGESETCCGDVVYHTGEDYFLEELAQNNADIIEKSGAPVVLTVSPHTYNMLKNIYPKYGAKIGVPIMTHVQYLSEVLSGGRLKPKPPKRPRPITYHDPCYLGRWNNVYEEPRQLIEAIPGIRLVEMEHNRSYSLCCGGGGGSIWMENKDARRVTKRRLREAKDTGAVEMATACPYCIRMFEDELKIERLDVGIVDVVELLDEATRE